MKRLLMLLFLFGGLQTAQARQTADKTGATVNVSGTLRWTDSQGGLHPIRFADLEVLDDNVFSNPKVAEVRTDGNGFYSVNVESQSDLDLFLRVFAHSRVIDVLAPGVRNPPGAYSNSYYVESDTHSDITTDVTIDLDVPNTNNAGKAFSILDGLIVAAQFSEGLLGAPLPLLPVEFPGNGGNSQVVGSPGPNLHMQVLASDSYDWDVLHHEYGHVVQRYHDVADLVPGRHELGWHLSEQYGKSTGTRLAWGEGWPSFFAIVVQEEMNVSAMNIPNAGDLRFQDVEGAGGLDYGLESRGLIDSMGEDDEVAVQRILWDLYDSANDKGDEVSLGFGPIWSAMLAASPKNLSGFWNALTDGKTMKMKSDYGGVFAEWGVAPMPKDPVDGYTVSLDGGGRAVHSKDGGTLTLTWDEHGGGGDNFWNDKFFVEFYNPDLTFLIHTSPELTVPEYTPTEDDWYKINYSTFTPEGNNVRWIIKGRNTDSPETGEYISPAYLIDAGVDVGFVVDTHGSMGGKLNDIQEQIIQILDNYPDDRKTLFQLTNFDGTIYEDAPFNDRFPTHINGAFAGHVASLSAIGDADCEDKVESGYAALITRYLEMDVGGSVFLATNRTVKSEFLGDVYQHAISRLRSKRVIVDVLLMGPECPKKATAAKGAGAQDALQAYVYMARETGGTFVYLPEAENGGPTEAQRLKNTVSNMTRGTLGAAITFIETPTAPPGADLTVTLQAGKTHFDAGTTLDFGPGITVSHIETVSPTKLNARLNIAPGTTLGFRDVTATTPLDDGSVEAATGNGVFEIAEAPTTPVLLSVFPGESAVGETLTITLDGFNTHFDASSSIDMGEGITVLSVNPVSANQLEATVMVEEAAPSGFHQISIQTGTETATAQRQRTFFVLEGSSSAAIATIIPETGAAGAMVSVAITGQGTSFQSGISNVSFSGSGITVLNATVATPDLLVATLHIDADAQNGLRDVVVTTGGEAAFLTGGFEVTGGASGVAVEAQEGLPTTYRLAQNYPNPFNPTTVIPFDIKQTGPVRLTVYDALGREVARLVDRMMTQGAYTVDFNAEILPSGLYFYQLRAGNTVLNRKMILAK